MNGVLIIDKSAGWTSMDVCAKLRGVFREKRVGHAGTLDPMATGVLPVFLGRATRAVEFAADSDKEYLAGIKLGVITDTQDTTGTV
ncbi:MAG: pseudouridine synthase, partial [Oscillospiraceae bacterium]